jgi:hypothetical protein
MPASRNHRRHVGALGNHVDAVLQQAGSVGGTDLVLRGAREGTVGLVVPQRIGLGRRVFLGVHRALVLLRVLLDAPAPHVLQLHHEAELFTIDAGLVVDVAAAVRQGHRLAAEIE